LVGLCARAVSGQAAAPATSAVKSRRLIRSPRRPTTCGCSLRARSYHPWHRRVCETAQSKEGSNRAPQGTPRSAGSRGFPSASQPTAASIREKVVTRGESSCGHFMAIRFGAPRSERAVRDGPFLTQRRHSCIAANCPSFDHLVGAGEQRGRHGEAERFRRLEIDDQFQPGALLNRDVSRLCTLEDFSGVNPHLLS
jgi:hypothetical protein